MPTPIVREFGRKPYIDSGKGQDGGYINAMRRTTQTAENNADRSGTMINNQRRGSISQIDERGTNSVFGLISEYVLPGVAWGITFDAGGGLYAGINAGDILYRPSGGSFGALGQTPRAWEEMACAVNGDIYIVVFSSAIYIRPGGTGDFTLFEAGAWTCLDSDPNGDVYALKGNNLYIRTPGAATFGLVAGVTTRGYTALSCAPNGDLYATEYATNKVYVRTGRVGDLVELQSINGCRALAAAPNGDVYVAPYTGYDNNIYKRAGGAGNFEIYFDTITRNIQDMAVCPVGELANILFFSSNYYSDYQISQVNTQTTLLPAKNTIVQSHATPGSVAQPLYKNAKPYLNKSYEEMQQFAQPMNYTGREQAPETAGALPILIDHIPEVSRFVRNGSPVVIDIPTNEKDPVSRVEIYARVDGMASVAPNGTSVIYNPGASGAALLIVHTRSGQQCTVSLMAK